MLKKFINILPKYGYLTFTSFILTALSGVLLSLVYDPSSAQLSISKMLIQNPAGSIIRSMHYWSAQLFLILSIIHIIDHLLKYRDINLSSGVWLRTVLSFPVIIFVMLSGFFLRGDGESSQAILIFSTIIKSIPIAGDILSFFLLGSSGNLQVIYVHHIATATIIIWLTASEHSRIIFSDRQSYIWILPLTIILSLLFVPSIHLPENLLIKSPWYFVGLQEFLHWFNFPLITILIFVLLIAGIYFYRRITGRGHYYLSRTLLSLALIYLILSITGGFFRGEFWKFDFSLQNINNSFNYFCSFDYLKSEKVDSDIRIVNNRPESCLSCHSGMKGLATSHNPDSIGCYSCHLGNPLSLNKEVAHSGMVITPGNLSASSKTCGSANCHIGITERVSSGLMNTMSGVIAVDKFVFGESQNLNSQYHIKHIANSPADSHLRGLCAVCHLGNEKTLPEPVSELSRGGGCSACHLQYSPDAEKALLEWKKNRRYNISIHPDINLKVSNNSCFGCHSRSGRISTNYEGWHETQIPTTDFNKLEPKSNFRLLMDGRVFVKTQEDIHYQKGMECIDCHTSYEIMGNGIQYSHKESAVQIQCTDCHRTSDAKTSSFERMDTESQKIIKLRHLFAEGRQFVLLAKSGLPLVNIYPDKLNNPLQRLKNRDTILPLRKPLTQCTNDIPGHSRLSCRTCHTSWAPQCISCHTGFDKNAAGWDNLLNQETKGAWIEDGNNYLDDAPALGIINEKNGKEIVGTFVPGMIMTLAQSGKIKSAFHRLYAPAFSHTITLKSRDCRSCHNNPLALGYGRGKLEYSVNKLWGNWIFSPQFKLSEFDKLPLDAWIGFLSFRTNATTRTNCRPFNIDEQKKILTVGACLTCHKESERRMKMVFKDFSNFRKYISKRCILPEY